eukprot:g57499.t1
MRVTAHYGSTYGSRYPLGFSFILLLAIQAAVPATFSHHAVWWVSLNGSAAHHLQLWSFLAGLPAAEVSVWSEWVTDDGREELDVSLGPKAAQELRTLLGSMDDVQWQVKIPDLQILIDAERQQIASAGQGNQETASLLFFFDTYRTYEEMLVFLQGPLLEAAAADGTLQYRLHHLPNATFQGNTQVVAQLTRNSPAGLGSKPIIYWQSGLHAREWVGPMACLYVLYSLVTGAQSDPDTAALLERYEVHVLPVVNVDGYKYTWTNDRLWRKTRTIHPTSTCVGADPNRNYGHDSWSKLSGASSSPCSDTFYGTAPWSELCVKTSANYMLELKYRLLSVMDHHSYGQTVMFPWAYTTNLTPDHPTLYKVAEAAVQAVQKSTDQVYSFGSIARALYVVTGNAKDWFYDPNYLGVLMSFGSELRPRQVADTTGFLLPANEIVPTGKDVLAMLHSQVASFASLDLVHARGSTATGQCACEPGFYDGDFAPTCSCLPCPPKHSCAGAGALPVALCAERRANSTAGLMTGCPQAAFGERCTFVCRKGARSANGGQSTCSMDVNTMGAAWSPQPACSWPPSDDYCQSQPCGAGATCLHNPAGGYSCICPAGFQPASDGSCKDVDECLSAPCDSLAVCINQAGSFSCVAAASTISSTFPTFSASPSVSTSPTPTLTPSLISSSTRTPTASSSVAQPATLTTTTTTTEQPATTTTTIAVTTTTDTASFTTSAATTLPTTLQDTTTSTTSTSSMPAQQSTSFSTTSSATSQNTIPSTTSTSTSSIPEQKSNSSGPPASTRPIGDAAMSPSPAADGTVSCITQNGPYKGSLCIFPFSFQDKMYNYCTDIGKVEPWCAVDVDQHLEMTSWSYCGGCGFGPADEFKAAVVTAQTFPSGSSIKAADSLGKGASGSFSVLLVVFILLAVTVGAAAAWRVYRSKQKCASEASEQSQPTVYTPARKNTQETSAQAQDAGSGKHVQEEERQTPEKKPDGQQTPDKI